MPRASRPNTVNASNKVCARGLATLSSTAATPCGRSVTDSSRFTLIMLPLLSAPDQQPPPSLELSLACSPDQTFARRLRSDGTDRKPPPVYRNVVLRNQPGRAAWIHRRQIGRASCRERV